MTKNANRAAIDLVGVALTVGVGVALADVYPSKPIRP